MDLGKGVCFILDNINSKKCVKYHWLMIERQEEREVGSIDLGERLQLYQKRDSGNSVVILVGGV